MLNIGADNRSTPISEKCKIFYCEILQFNVSLEFFRKVDTFFPELSEEWTEVLI